eukprot:m.457023 g.457023  ORF g.457023 m.457023 type:complete len:356 (+) comp21576_c0_seq18:295-1362(+)
MSETTDVPAASETSGSARNATAIICLGMAGSGKTSLVQRLNAHLHQASKPCYLVNLDPAVDQLPYEANIDVRDTVKYKEVMKQYGLGPNGGIVTSLNLFATKFDQVLRLVKERSVQNDYMVFDTPGQIEVFTYSASGQIITETLAATVPTVVVYVVDTPRCTSPTTFMSNMLYACSIMYKAKLPFILAFNKVDVVSHEFAAEWMTDFTALQDAIDESSSYMASLSRSMGLVLSEFYETLRTVGVSAHTGAGMDEFFAAVDSATAEYHAEYVPLLAKMKEDKDARARRRAADTAAKAQSAAKGDVVVDAAGRGGVVDPQSVGVVDADLPTGPDLHEDDLHESADHAALARGPRALP